jgi:hypothetical protein
LRAAKAPYLVVVNAARKQAVVGLADEAAIKAAILKLLEGLAPAPVEKAPEPEKKPVAGAWPTDYEAARKAALAPPHSPMAVLFAAAADAKGQKELEDALFKDEECGKSLGKMIRVRLDTAGTEGAKNLELQKAIDPSRTPPILCLVQVSVDDKGAETRKTLGVVDSVNLLAEKDTYLAKVRAQLAEAALQGGAKEEPKK